MGKNLVYTACTSKISTTFKVYNLAVFDQNSMKLVQGGPLNLRNFKNGQKFGVNYMYLQTCYSFKGLYLGFLRFQKLGKVVY